MDKFIRLEDLPEAIRILPVKERSWVQWVDYYDVVIPEHNWDDIVQYVYNPEWPAGSCHELQQAVKDWLRENVRTSGRLPNLMWNAKEKTGLVRFLNEKDAIHFKLRWIG